MGARLARSAAAAALALLIGGDVARLGWDAVGPGRFLFPWLWLFLLLDAARVRRRIEDGEVFLAGAAAALLHGGVYAKNLQHGFYPLGVDWLGAVEACFDGGMTAVLALHLRARLGLRPADGGDGAAPGDRAASLFTAAALVLILGGAACVYSVKTVFRFYRAERLLGPTWLLGDLLFASAAGALALRAKRRSEEDEEPGREAWAWVLAAFVVWLPGARLVARLCGAAGLHEALLYFFVGAWTAASAVLFRAAYRREAEAGPLGGARPASAAALAAAAGRAGGAALLALTWGGALGDVRSAGAFSALVALPTRVLFAWAFLTSRLKV